MHMKSAIPTALRPAELAIGYMEQESILSSAKKKWEEERKEGYIVQKARGQPW